MKGQKIKRLITSSVALLGPFNLQRPLVVLFVMSRLKSLVTRVGVTADREDVNVTMTNPRYGLVAQAPHTTTEIGGLACVAGEIGKIKILDSLIGKRLARAYLRNERSTS